MNFITSLNRIAEGFLTSYAWPVLWQTALLVVIITAAAWTLFRKASPQFRYLLWLLVLVRLALPPAAYLPTGIGNWGRALLDLLPPSARQEQMESRSGEASPTPIFFQVPDAAISEYRVAPKDYVKDYVTASIPPAAVSLSKHALLFLAWAVGIAGLLSFLLIRLIRFQWLLRGAVLPGEALSRSVADYARRLGMRRDVKVRVTDAPCGPIVCGFLRPVIVLPRRILLELSQEELAPVLIHELAHVKRGDWLVNWLQVLSGILYFFHPFLWYANRQIRQEREKACDDLVLVALGLNRKGYVNSLMRVRDRVASRMGLLPALVGIVERRSNLSARILRILDPRTRPSAKLSLLSILTLIAFACCFLTFAAKAQISERENPLNSTESRQPSAEERDAPPSTPEKRNILGIVKDAKGQPQENAEVLLLRFLNPWDFTAAQLGSTKTGADGKFAFDQPKPVGGLYLLMASKPGHAWGGRIVPRTRENEENTPIDVVLGEPKPLAGQVVNRKGEPVSGARVYPLTANPANSRLHIERIYVFPGMEKFAVKTDAAGRFRFEQLPAGWKAGVLVRHPDYANLSIVPPDNRDSALYSALFDVGKEDIRLELAVPGKIQGRLTDSLTSRPVAGVTLEAYATRQSPDPIRHMATTDADGRYEMKNLAPGDYTIAATSNALEGMVQFLSGVKLEEGQVLNGINLSKKPGIVVKGRVIEKESGKGLPDITVRAYQRGTEENHPPPWMSGGVQTDTEGRFKITAPEGTISLSYRRPEDSQTYVRNPPLTLKQGEAPDEVVIALPPTGTGPASGSAQSKPTPRPARPTTFMPQGIVSSITSATITLEDRRTGTAQEPWSLDPETRVFSLKRIQLADIQEPRWAIVSEGPPIPGNPGEVSAGRIIVYPERPRKPMKTGMVSSRRDATGVMRAHLTDAQGTLRVNGNAVELQADEQTVPIQSRQFYLDQGGQLLTAGQIVPVRVSESTRIYEATPAALSDVRVGAYVSVEGRMPVTVIHILPAAEAGRRTTSSSGPERAKSDSETAARPGPTPKVSETVTTRTARMQFRDFDISGDSMRVDWMKGTMTALGNVRLSFNEGTATCQKVEYGRDRNTGAETLALIGNAVVVSASEEGKGIRITAEKFIFTLPPTEGGKVDFRTDGKSKTEMLDSVTFRKALGESVSAASARRIPTSSLGPVPGPGLIKKPQKDQLATVVFIVLPRDELPKKPDLANAFFDRVVEVIEAMLYARDGKEKARTEGRWMRVDRATGQVTITDYPERLRDISDYLHSLTDPGVNRREYIFLKYRAADEKTFAEIETALGMKPGSIRTPEPAGVSGAPEAGKGEPARREKQGAPFSIAPLFGRWNAIVVAYSDPRDLARVKEAIAQLDRPEVQAEVETLILEVQAKAPVEVRREMEKYLTTGSRIRAAIRSSSSKTSATLVTTDSRIRAAIRSSSSKTSGTLGESAPPAATFLHFWESTDPKLREWEKNGYLNVRSGPHVLVADKILAAFKMAEKPSLQPAALGIEEKSSLGDDTASKTAPRYLLSVEFRPKVEADKRIFFQDVKLAAGSEDAYTAEFKPSLLMDENHYIVLGLLRPQADETPSCYVLMKAQHLE